MFQSQEMSGHDCRDNRVTDSRMPFPMAENMSVYEMVEWALLSPAEL